MSKESNHLEEAEVLGVRDEANEEGMMSHAFAPSHVLNVILVSRTRSNHLNDSWNISTCYL
jgi:hypothetical protein